MPFSNGDVVGYIVGLRDSSWYSISFICMRYSSFPSSMSSMRLALISSEMSVSRESTTAPRHTKPLLLLALAPSFTKREDEEEDDNSTALLMLLFLSLSFLPALAPNFCALATTHELVVDDVLRPLPTVQFITSFSNCLSPSVLERVSRSEEEKREFPLFPLDERKRGGSGLRRNEIRDGA